MAVLGIDIGGTKVATRWECDGVGEDGSFLWPGVGSGVDDDVAALARHLEAVWEVSGGAVRAAGVAVPATLDRAGRVVAWPNRPQWIGHNLRDTVAGLLPGAEVRWGDDGELAGLAEADAARLTDVVYFGIGTGIGGAIVIGSQLVPGAGRGSAELGHMVLDLAGPRCTCGRQGCLQALASGPATLRRAARMAGGTATFDQLRAGWSAGAWWAVNAVEESCDALAAAVVSVHEMLHTDAVVIGGGFAAGLPGFVPVVGERTARWARQGHPAPPVREAVLGGLSSLAGALLLARRSV